MFWTIIARVKLTKEESEISKGYAPPGNILKLNADSLISDSEIKLLVQYIESLSLIHI